MSGATLSPEQRAELLGLYAEVRKSLERTDRAAPLYRALCQLRAEIERACELPRTPTQASTRRLLT